jgi:Zn-dependent metalloprotease
MHRCNCFVVSSDMLSNVALNAPDPVSRAAAVRSLDTTKTLQMERQVRFRSVANIPPPENLPLANRRLRRTIRDARHRETDHGHVVRQEGQDPRGDTAVDNLYDYVKLVYDYFLGLGRFGITGKSGDIEASAHYGAGYDNAFWDGNSFQCGDGDGRLFNPFDELSVVIHECVHGVTGAEADLVYFGQSGALAESVSDCFAQVVRIPYLGLALDDPRAWLIGETLLAPGVNGRALRDMANPGTAYDDPVLGTDTQPRHMRGYAQGKGDNGGVHRNSGVPNFAFVKTVQGLGDLDLAGRILYETLCSGVPEDCTFETWAKAQVIAARTLGGPAAATVALRAWSDVGVLDFVSA